MRECGRVIQTEGPKAIVQIEKSAHCGGCTACNMFDDGQGRRITAVNRVSARIGDRVELEVEPGRVVGYSFLIFIFPLLMLFVGYALGSSLASHWSLTAEQTGILAGLGLLVISFLPIFWFNKRSGSNHVSAHIVSILN